MGVANDALFGDTNYSRIPADSLSPAAENEQDFGKVLLTGIVNGVNRAIQNKVDEASASGQIVLSADGMRVSASQKLIQALLIGGLIYLMVK